MDKHNPFDAQIPIQGGQHPSQTSSSSNSSKEQLSASPQGRHSSRKGGSKGSLYLSDHVEQQTYLLVHLLGYGLLVFSLLDYIYIVIPPRFTDPNWELQTIGAFVDHVAAPLLGLLFVFYRHQGYIGKGEKNLLGVLSWVSLLVGLVYLLLVPLGIMDTGRIYHANNAQINAQFSQKRQQLQQMKGKLNQATTDEQIEQFFAALASEGRSPQIKNPLEFKNRALADISQAERNMQAQADSVRSTQLKALGKNSLKWNLGALVAGVVFIWVWHLTHWARVKDLRAKSAP